MKITREEKFTLILTGDELKTIRQGLFAYIESLRPEDYVGSDPSEDSMNIIDAVNDVCSAPGLQKAPHRGRAKPSVMNWEVAGGRK